MLVLFDIDGTLLLTSDPLYGEALVEAVRKIYGLELTADSLRRVDHPGETAMSGLRLLLRAEGLSLEAIGQDLRRWCELHAEVYTGQGCRRGAGGRCGGHRRTTGGFGRGDLAGADAVVARLAHVPDAVRRISGGPA